MRSASLYAGPGSSKRMLGRSRHTGSADVTRATASGWHARAARRSTETLTLSDPRGRLLVATLGFAGAPETVVRPLALGSAVLARFLGRDWTNRCWHSAPRLGPPAHALRRARLAGDVLHDRHGALADERDGHRVGAHAVASDAASGVGGNQTPDARSRHLGPGYARIPRPKSTARRHTTAIRASRGRRRAPSRAARAGPAW
jgi:hypothetical protein